MPTDPVPRVYTTPAMSANWTLRVEYSQRVANTSTQPRVHAQDREPDNANGGIPDCGTWSEQHARSNIT